MDSEKKLKDCREKIDRIDSNIIELIMRRFVLVRKVGSLKKQAGLPVRNKKRELEIIGSLAKKSGLKKTFLGRLYRTIFEEAYRLEK